MQVGGAASAPPQPDVRDFADAGMTTPAAPRNIPAAQDHVPVHRLSEEQGLTAERNDLDGRGMAQGQLLAHHPGRVADGPNQAQHHAGDRGTTAVRLRDADHENTAERHGHPGGQPTREPLVQQPASLTPPG